MLNPQIVAEMTAVEAANPPADELQLQSSPSLPRLQDAEQPAEGSEAEQDAANAKNLMDQLSNGQPTVINEVDPKELDARIQQINHDALEDSFINYEEETKLKKMLSKFQFVIDPENNRYLAFLCLTSAAAVYSIGVAAFEIAFFSHFRDKFRMTYIIDLVIDVIFLVNIAVSMRAGYFVADTKEMRREIISKRYLKSKQGWSDIMACIPLDVIQAATGWHPIWRVNKLFRIWSLSTHTYALQISTTKPFWMNLITLTRLVLTWLLIPHLACCCRILIAQVSARE